MAAAHVAPLPQARGANDLAAELEKMPFFMTEAPLDKHGEESDNVALEALRSLVYEGTPEEIADNLRVQANGHFQRKCYREALTFYTQALNEVGEAVEPPTKRTLLSNRAAAQLELANYGLCIKDCADALRVSSAPDPTTRKLLFRTSRALVGVDKLDEASATLATLQSLGADPSEAAEAKIQALSDKVERLRTSRAEAAARRQAELAQQQQSALALKSALTTLGLILPPRWTARSAADACPSDVRPPRLDGDVLSFPVFVLRPLSSPPTRDLILDWREDDMFGEQLDGNFGAEIVDCDFFAVTSRSRVLKVGRKLTLRLLSQAARKDDGDGLPLVSGWCLEVYIVPRDRAKGWADEMKRQ